MKLIIIGNGGTGKSTLGNKLSGELGIPVTHLDLLSWKDNFERVPEDVFTSNLREAMKSSDMIIEGWAYHSTMKERIDWADVIIYLKYPLDYCHKAVLARNEEYNNKPYPYDSFTGDRLAKTELYNRAVTMVHEVYEPEVMKWLVDPGVKGKMIFTIGSIEELNVRYREIVEAIKYKLA